MRPSAKPRLTPRARASASGVSGAVAAISSSVSSFSMRWRGMLTRCASRSRHAAMARSRPSMAAVGGARAQPLPQRLRVGAVGRRVGEHRHLLGHPLQPAVARQPLAQLLIDAAQMRHVGGGVGRSAPAESGRAAQSLKRCALSICPPVSAETSAVVADLIAEAGHHGGDLGVEQRARHVAEAQHENLDVLARGVEHLRPPRGSASSAPSGARSMPGASASTTATSSRAAELHHAQLRPVGALAHELGVDGDEGLGAQAVAEGGERVGGGDQDGGRELRPLGTGHRRLLHGGCAPRQCAGRQLDRRRPPGLSARPAA